MFCHAIWLARAINLLKTDTSMHSFLAVFSFQCSVATNISPKQPCESSEASVAFVLLVIFVARAECYHRWYTYRFFSFLLCALSLTPMISSTKLLSPVNQRSHWNHQ